LCSNKPKGWQDYSMQQADNKQQADMGTAISKLTRVSEH